MKINELIESTATPADLVAVQKMVFAAIEAANVRNAEFEVRDLRVDTDGVVFLWIYEFPEHRTGLIKEVRKAVGKLGKVSYQTWNNYGQYAAEFDITFKDKLSEEDAKKLEAAIRTKYK